MKYFIDHWRGDLPLFHAFWVNLVAVRGFVFWLDSLFESLAQRDPETALQIYVPFAVVLHGGLLVWQIVGAVRSLDGFVSARGAMHLVWGAQLGIGLLLCATLVRVFISIQPMLLGPAGEPMHMIWERERASKYDVSLSPDGRVLKLTGEFELGLSKAMTVLLGEHPDIRTVSLESGGGRIYVGRAMAKLIEGLALDTYVAGTCKSACATAFIAGKKRVLGPKGRIGFHQYGDEAKKPNPFSDLDAEQERDRAYFARRGVSADFLSLIFDAPATSIWFPTHAELLAAGVVHEIEGR